jgi:membrane-associated phospholipid phosphatase
VKSLPILGIGERPKGATSCGFILDNIEATSFGMPSGHSQMIWTLGTYLICKAIDNWINKNKDNNVYITTQLKVFGYMWIILVCAIILLIMIFVSYSRVYIEGCHTIQQVFAGGILGVITGFIIYYFENDALKVLSKII